MFCDRLKIQCRSSGVQLSNEELGVERQVRANHHQEHVTQRRKACKQCVPRLKQRLIMTERQGDSDHLSLYPVRRDDDSTIKTGILWCNISE